MKSAAEPRSEAPTPAHLGKSSALLGTRILYCGDNLEQLTKLPDACVDMVYLVPPFNSNRNCEVFGGETKKKRGFNDRHASTQASGYSGPPVRKLVIALGVAAALVMGSMGCQSVNLPDLQSQCLNYTPPPTRIIYEEEPSEASKLLQEGNYAPAVGWFATGSAEQNENNHAVALKRPWFLDAFLAESDIHLRPPRGKYVVGFMGELKTPSGRPRLVVVEFFEPKSNLPDVYVIKPGTLQSPPELMDASWYCPTWDELLAWNWGLSTLLMRPANGRIYAGQVDPTDRSHFTIRYRAWNNENYIDGRIDDQDVVTMHPRGWGSKKVGSKM